MKKTGIAVLLLLGMTVLGGCQGVEPENRIYPMAMAAEATDEGYQVILGMPDMQSATGQEKQGEGESRTVLSLEGKDFAEIRNLYNRTQEKYLDMGHLKALVLGERMIEEKKWGELLTYLKDERFIGEDIYVFQCDDVNVLMENNGSQGISVGEYLTGIYENRPRDRARKGITLREVYHNWYRWGKLPVLPEVKAGSGTMELEPV